MERIQFAVIQIELGHGVMTNRVVELVEQLIFHFDGGF
jgi:hypothetical protein